MAQQPPAQAPMPTPVIDIRSYIIPIVTPINRTIEALNGLPRSFYTASIDASRGIASKLQEYAEAMSGKSSMNDNETQGLMIEKKHRVFLDSLRKTNMNKYRELLRVVEQLKGQPLDVQKLIIKAHFAQQLQPGMQKPKPSA